MPNIGAPELIIVLIVLLLVVGPGKLPEMGSAFGKTLREFRKASSDLSETTNAITRPPQTPGAAQSQAPAANELSQPIAGATLITSATDLEAVGVVRNVSPLGTPADAIEPT